VTVAVFFRRFWWALVLAAMGVYTLIDPAGALSAAQAPFYLAAYLTGLRGQRLTHASTDDNGDIVESPEELAAAASSTLGRDVSVDAYALARNIHSEEGGSGQSTQLAIAFVAINVAGGDLVGLLTRCKRASGSGKFGSQTGRWASTASDPYEGDLQVAELALSGQVADPTGGAVHYFRPGLQDILLGEGKVSKSADEVDAAWGGDGYNVPGADEAIFLYKAA